MAFTETWQVLLEAIGKLDMKDGRGFMTDWKYANGKDLQPSDDFVKARRPAEATK
jgi:branched-chain amino acid transport system substrate-binding protein